MVQKNKLKPTATKQLWMAVEACGAETCIGDRTSASFPPEFLQGLRELMESGLTCEELCAFMMLVTRLHETMDRFGGEELLRRCAHLTNLIRADLVDLAAAEAWMERVRQARRRGVKTT